MREHAHLIRRWALDLAAAAVLVFFLICAVPFGPAWLSFAIHDLEYDGATHLLKLPLLALWLASWTLVRGVRHLVTGPLAERVSVRTRTLFADENGALVLEFALVFPFIMSLVFIVFQWAELLMADGLLHYAAFSAARTAATYAAAVQDPTQDQGAGRFLLDQQKKEAMKRSATLALNGAFALEGGATHQEVRIDFQTSSNGQPLQAQNDTAIRVPDTRNGAYRYVHVNVHWGFCPRWPMAFLFFKPLITDRRIQMDGQYIMMVDGYYRSPTLNTDVQDGETRSGQDHFNSATQMEDEGKREGLIQKALYREVLKEAHGASQPVTGNRQSLASGCKNQ